MDGPKPRPTLVRVRVREDSPGEMVYKVALITRRHSGCSRAFTNHYRRRARSTTPNSALFHDVYHFQFGHSQSFRHRAVNVLQDVATADMFGHFTPDRTALAPNYRTHG